LKARILRNILIALLAVVFAVSAFHTIKITHDYKTADKANTELQERFVNQVDPTPEPTPETTSDAAIEEKIHIPISIDFEALAKENEDIIGWIYSPDTPINYPVVQGENNDQYLRADLKGKYLVSGTIFADYRNSTVGNDNNLIIYGHNMKNSTMFGTLVKYKDQAYYDEHPILYFLTPDNDYVIELVAGAVVKRDSDIYRLMPLAKTVEDIISTATFHSDVEVTENDKLITLSTCSYEFNNARYVLIGKLKRA
jgi:sortase B